MKMTILALSLMAVLPSLADEVTDRAELLRYFSDAETRIEALKGTNVQFEGTSLTLKNGFSVGKGISVENEKVTNFLFQTYIIADQADRTTSPRLILINSEDQKSLKADPGLQEELDKACQKIGFQKAVIKDSLDTDEAWIDRSSRMAVFFDKTDSNSESKSPPS